MRLRAGLRHLSLILAAVATPAMLEATEPMASPLPKPLPPTSAVRSLNVFPPQVNLDGPRPAGRRGSAGQFQPGSRAAPYEGGLQPGGLSRWAAWPWRLPAEPARL